MTNINDITDATLLRVISEGSDKNWEFFAVKVMISRLKMKLSLAYNRNANDFEQIKQQCCNEMRDLFGKSKHIPNARNDLNIIAEQFGKSDCI